MKTANYLPVAALVLVLPAFMGCTNAAWYEGMKRGAENRCNLQPPGERDRCLERISKQTHDEYEKERSGQKP
jgi:hypothetical protein